MFDTMTFTKIAGGFCGAFLVFLLGKWAAEEIYHTAGHGEAAYVVEVEEAEGGGDAAEAVDFGAIMASADPAKGANVFKKCSACHKLEKGANATGPYLFGVVGRPIGAAEGFGYSAALAEKGGDWTPEHLSEFLTKPAAYAPGTTMGFAGLKKIEDRADVIAYLQSVSQ